MTNMHATRIPKAAAVQFAAIVAILMSASFSAADEALVTVAESSDFEATCTSQQCETFVYNCSVRAGHIDQITFGSTVEDRNMVAAVVSRPTAVITDRDERLRILVIGNIHSGECAGKEAILLLLRSLVEDEQHRWLKNAVIVFVPNYNADANDKMSLDNRPGQIGPAKGMGLRENAQGLDLNRDFIKAESPEATALLRLMNDFDPHLFIDCHTTNGSKHRYELTYDIPHNPATAAPIRDYLRQKMMPRVTNAMQSEGLSTFYYGNFDRDHTTWTTYGFEPRYSTEYVGLRGRLAVLSEAYSYIPYRDRILATKAFVTACLDDVIASSATVAELIRNADGQLTASSASDAQPISLPLDAEVAPFEQTFVVKGYKDDQPHDYTCRFLGDFQPTLTTTLPAAYLVPAAHEKVVALLQKHGIQISQLSEDRSLEVEIDRLTELKRSERPFQGHRMQRAGSVRRTELHQIPAGTWIVRTNQPLGRLASYILEPQSNDGLVVWNFLDDVIAVDRDYPILRAGKF